MSFNYQKGGSWRSATVKRRENGQWVEVASSGGDEDGGTAPSRYYTDGPPTRSGATIRYPADGYSSLQAAYEALNENDTLVIESGTHTERIRLGENPSDHITITGEGDRDTTLVQPDTDFEYTVGIGLSETTFPHSNEASLANAYTNNESVIEVNNISPFEGQVGEVIHITENEEPYVNSGTGAGYRHEYKEIVSVDSETNEIELNAPLKMSFPGNASTEVGVTPFTIEDIRISNLTIEGDPSLYSGTSDNPRVLKTYDMREIWADNLRVQNGYNTNDTPLVNVAYTFRARFNNIILRENDHYGFTINHGSTDTYLTNIEYHMLEGEDPSNIGQRYAVRFGHTGNNSRGAVGGLASSIQGYNFRTRVANVHLGGYHCDFEDVYADNCEVIRLRSKDVNLYGFTEENGQDHTITHAQNPIDCLVKNGRIINKQDGYIFHYRTGLNSRDYDYLENVTYENIRIDAYDNRTAADIGFFTADGAELYGDLVFRDVYYDGAHLTETDITNWMNYDLTNTNDYNIVIEETD